MATSTADHLASYAATLQPNCPEAIVAVGAVKRPGAMTDMLRQEIGGKAGRFLGGFGGRAAARKALAPAPAPDGMPDDLLLACTASTIHAFGYRMRGFGKLEVTGAWASWDRTGLVVTTEPAGRLTQRLLLRWPDGAEVQLDAVLPPGRNQDLNAGFLATVGATPAPT